MIRYAVFNDVHLPYEGKCFYKALDAVKSWDNLEGIYLNGDILEVESLSRYPKGPQAINGFKKEVDYANTKFDFIQKLLGDIPVTLVEGNHCHRLFRYIRDVAPQLWGMLEHPDLFRFKERGWRFVPYGPRQWVKCGKADLWLRHEPLVGGINCAKGTAANSLVDVLFGHTHVHQIAVHKLQGPTPKMIRAYSGGWLGDIRQSVFDYRGSRDNWVNGFNEIICESKSGVYEYRFHYF